MDVEVFYNFAKGLWNKSASFISLPKDSQYPIVLPCHARHCADPQKNRQESCCLAKLSQGSLQRWQNYFWCLPRWGLSMGCSCHGVGSGQRWDAKGWDAALLLLCLREQSPGRADPAVMVGPCPGHWTWLLQQAQGVLPLPAAFWDSRLHLPLSSP